MREFISLTRVAWDAGADDIFPSGLTAAIAGEDMVDIETATVEDGSAVLAGVLIAFEDIVPGEFDLFFRQAIKETEDDDARDTNLERDRLEHFRLGMRDGKIAPACVVVCEKITRSVGSDDLCVPLIKQDEGPTGRAGIDSLPQPVEYKHWLIEQIIHDRVVDS